ncbi:MAG: hypothetical protein WAN65_27210 [Candidatus Sulfotelmatobacter sp.]
MLRVAAVSMVLLAGLGFAQKQTDWINTSNSPEIQYRVQLFDDAKTCYLDFRDKKQGKGYTTFDAAVDYKSMDSDSDSNSNSQQSVRIKSENEHIVTAATQTGSARISDCSGISEIKVNYIQRH